MIASVGRLWRTVRYLRPVQFYGRLSFKLYRPRPDISPPPVLRSRPNIWHASAERPASLVGPTRFRFLNAEADLTKIGWDRAEQAKLWRYNQHYFDDLNAEGWRSRAIWHDGLIDAWIKGNPPGKGTGWEPYPTSLRIINWIKWALSGSVLSNQALDSLAIQTRWLVQRMEWHLLGNHLFTNAKALVFVGLFFEGSEADKWLRLGLKILEQEMAEQILPDGGQFELSPMYHALAVEDMLDLINLGRAYERQDLVQDWTQHILCMLDWLANMSHPDGRISFFNDAAFSVAPPNISLLHYARRLGFETRTSEVPLRHLKDSGYVRMAAGEFLLIADFGRIGPDYLPGHAHADTLSFELSTARQRVFVNSGTSEYGAGPERQRQRGTAAHNTVTIGEENSSEVWAGFRVGRRARPQKVLVEQLGSMLHAEASHDGYRHLPGRPIVSRSFELNDKRLVVTDAVADGPLAEAHYHLHPDIKISALTDKGALLELPEGQRLEVICAGGSLRLEPSSWHPEFGISIPNQCLILPLAGGCASLTLMKV
jgi:uncharacterized heparinase superfamily protein